MKRYTLLIVVLIMTIASAATKTGVPSFCADFNQQDNSVERKKMKDSISGFEWTEVWKGDFVGAEINGKTIVPCRYVWVSYEEGYFTAQFYINDNSSKTACYTTTGTCLIHENRGYDFLYLGYVKDEGFILVGKNNKEGICGLDGKELIPTGMGYDQIFHNGENKNLYAVKKSGMWGVYDVGLKREIIVPKYSELFFHEADGHQYIQVIKDKKEGICLANGEEILPPLYKSVGYSYGHFYYIDVNDKYHDTNLTISDDRISSNDVASMPQASNVSSSSTSSTTTSSSSSTTSSTSSSPYGKLLFDGTFTGTGKGIAGNQLTTVGEPFLTSFKVYEKKIYCNNDDSSMDYCGEETLFNTRWRKYSNGGDFAYYVSSDGTILQSMTMTFDTLMGKMSSTSYTIYEHGDTRHLHGGSASTGNGNTPQNSNSGIPSSNTNPPRCSYCQGSGTCPNCNGTGWVTSPFAFGHATAQYPCVSCNKNGDKVNNPNKGKCSLCKGTGMR